MSQNLHNIHSSVHAQHIYKSAKGMLSSEPESSSTANSLSMLSSSASGSNGTSMLVRSPCLYQSIRTCVSLFVCFLQIIFTPGPCSSRGHYSHEYCMPYLIICTWPLIEDTKCFKLEKHSKIRLLILQEIFTVTQECLDILSAN